MEPAGRLVGVILHRIRNKDKSKPGDRSAAETKIPERADKIHRGGDGVTIRARQPSQGGLQRSCPACALSKQHYELYRKKTKISEDCGLFSTLDPHAANTCRRETTK